MFFSNNHGIPWFLSPAKSKKRIAQTLSGWSWLRKGFFTFDTVGNSFSLAFMMLIYANVSDTQQIAVILYWYYDIIYDYIWFYGLYRLWVFIRFPTRTAGSSAPGAFQVRLGARAETKGAKCGPGATEPHWAPWWVAGGGLVIFRDQ